MKIIDFPKNEYSKSKKLIVLGKFNIIHLGHKKLLEKARKFANENNLELIIMMFKSLQKGLLSFNERLMIINEYKPNYIMIFEPNDENFKVEKEIFIDWLKKIFVTNIIIGEDFRFGHKRKGSSIDLINNFNTQIIKEYEYNNKKISSFELTNDVINGNLKNFKNKTGFYFFYKGRVLSGHKRGKKLGFPTANVEFSKDRIMPSSGIYLSYIIIDNQKFPSITSISNNPTFNDNNEIFYETYILNFDKDIYGKEVCVELIDKIRNSIKFSKIDDLIKTMNNDKLIAKIYFNI